MLNIEFQYSGDAKFTRTEMTTSARRALNKYAKGIGLFEPNQYKGLIIGLAIRFGSYVKFQRKEIYDYLSLNACEDCLSETCNEEDIQSLLSDLQNVVEYCSNAYDLYVSSDIQLEKSYPDGLCQFCLSLLNIQNQSNVLVSSAGYGDFLVSLSDCICAGIENDDYARFIANLRLELKKDYQTKLFSTEHETKKANNYKYDYIIWVPSVKEIEGKGGTTLSKTIASYLEIINENGAILALVPTEYSYLSKKNKKYFIKKGLFQRFITLPSIFSPISNNSFSILILTPNANEYCILSDCSSFLESSSYNMHWRFLWREALSMILNGGDKYNYRWFYSLKSQKEDRRNEYNICPSRFLYTCPPPPEGKIYKPLGDIADFINIVDCPDPGVRLVASWDLSSNFSSRELIPRRFVGPGNNNYRVVKEPCVLLNLDMPLVKVGKVNQVPVAVKQGIYVLKIKKGIETDYLIKELLSDYVREQLTAYHIIATKRVGRLIDLKGIVKIAVPAEFESIKEEKNLSKNEIADLQKLLQKAHLQMKQDSEIKAGKESELETALERIQMQFKMYKEDTHLKKHTIGQYMLNLTTYWNALLRARTKNGGNLPDDYILGKNHPLSVKEIIDGISFNITEIANGIENFTYAENPVFEKKSEIYIDHFIRDYIANDTNPEYQILYQTNLDTTQQGRIYFSEAALKIIFQNIITNAWKHGFDKKTEENFIRISWNETEEDVIVYISNNGHPLFEISTDAIFDYGVSSVSCEKDDQVHSHSGLGCYQVKALMTIDGQGDVSVESRPNDSFPVTFKLIFHKQ